MSCAGDTDSVFWDLWPNVSIIDDPSIIKRAFDYCNHAAATLSEFFPAPNKLEFEKCMCPFILFDKKRYSGLLYSADLGPEKPKKIDHKGIQLVRRDTIDYVKRCMASVIDSIMYDKSIIKASRIAREFVDDLLNHRVPLDQLIISKKINSSYKTQATWIDGSKAQVAITPHGVWQTVAPPHQSGKSTVVPGKKWNLLNNGGNIIGTVTLTHPHVHVMQRIDNRCPGGGPSIGDRVKYVFVQNRSAILQIERAEDVEWAQHKNMAVDSLYYFEHCLLKPLESIFCIYYQDPYKTLFRDYHMKALNKYNKQPSIGSYFCKM